MKIDFVMREQTFVCYIPHLSPWKTYHVTKHSIINYNNEGYYLFIKKSNNEIEILRKKQIQKFNCKIHIGNNLQAICKACNCLNLCVAEIDELIKMYIGMIKTILKNDHMSPRYAEYCTKNQPHVIMLNSHGMTAIMKKRKNKFFLVTMYGFQQNQVNGLQYSFKKILGDKLWRRNSNIIYWKNRFKNNKRFEKVKMEIPFNWEIS